MVLVDTSVWVDHLRSREPEVASLVDKRQIVIHPMVIGELACGNLSNRQEVLRYLSRLPRTLVAKDDEVLFFIKQRRLMGCGIGYIDAHLLAATVLHGTMRLWTHDRQMITVADELDIRFIPSG